jgi:hypothetical protein
MRKQGVVSPEDLLEDLRFTLRRVLKWAEAYEPSRMQKRAYDADLDAAEALLSRPDAHVSPSKQD